MQEKAKEPEIRFAGFTGAWEQRKLGDVLEFLKDGTHGTHPDADQGPLLLSAKNIKNGDVTWDDTDRKISQAEFDMIHSNFKLKKGDVLLTIVGSIGESAILKDPHEITFQRSVAFLRPNKTITSGFLYSEIQGEKFQTELNNRKSTSAQPGIYLGDLSEIPLDTPPNLKEQEEIGKFFSEINSLLTLHQRKYEKLLNIKKSMLEKMFPKEGEVVPEIRFKGFTGAWEQRKLSDGMTEYTDRVFIEDDQIYRQVTVKNTGEISLRGSQPGRNIGRKRQARVNLRDYPMTLIFTRQTVEQGGIGFAKNDVDGCIVTENMPTIAVDGKKFNQDFLVAFFKTYGFRKDVILSNIEGGTAQIAIHEDDILDSSSTFPSLKEQIKIGNFFRTLSQQITLHQRKLEMLKNVKQAFLEKMFV